MTPPAFLKSAWSHIDANGDGNLSSRELKDALQNQFAQQKLSKMICYHQSEWGIDFGSLKSEVEVLLDEGIELEEDDTEKQKLQEEKKTILNTVEQKIKAFNFWSNVKIAIPESISSMPDDWIYDPILDVSRKRYAWEMTYEKQEKKEYKPFPKSNKVYHFHPIAFVEQMKRMEDDLSFYRWAHSPLGLLIAEKESNNNYNICNKIKGGLRVVRSVKVVMLSIREIQEKQKSGKIFAVGRYQLIPITLKAAVKELKLDINQKLSESMQDRIFEEYLISKKRPQIISYLEKEGSIHDAMYAAAKEWASIGVEKGKRISYKKIEKDGKVTYEKRFAEGGESFYAGDGLNQAHISPKEIKSVLEKSKNQFS